MISTRNCRRMLSQDLIDHFCKISKIYFLLKKSVLEHFQKVRQHSFRRISFERQWFDRVFLPRRKVGSHMPDIYHHCTITIYVVWPTRIYFLYLFLFFSHSSLVFSINVKRSAEWARAGETLYCSGYSIFKI